MINTRQAIIAQLVGIALVQNAVRNGETEGMVMDIETKFFACAELGLITFDDYEHLAAILNLGRKKNESSLQNYH